LRPPVEDVVEGVVFGCVVVVLLVLPVCGVVDDEVEAVLLVEDVLLVFPSL
jgi:hypothetical protein